MRWKIAQWFEKQWWRRYLKSKKPDEYLAWKKAYWKGFMAKLEIEPSGEILDAGCGPAGVFISLENVDVTAIDPLLGFYEAKLAHFNREMYSDVEFHQMSLEQIDFVDRFDQIFCINVINHVDSMTNSLKRLHHASKKNGQFIITTDCHKNGIWKFLLRLLPFDVLHPYQLSHSEYAESLQKAGWIIEKTSLLKQAFIFDYYAFVCRKG